MCKRERGNTERIYIGGVLKLLGYHGQIRVVKLTVVAHFADAFLQTVRDKARNLFQIHKIAVYKQLNGVKARKLRDNLVFAVLTFFLENVNFTR